MKILLTGATGYIGKRLLPVLLSQGHEVVCAVRDPQRFQYPQANDHKIKVIQADCLDIASLENIPEDIDMAYYLIHSMSVSGEYNTLELKCATNFRERMDRTDVEQVIYLGGIYNETKLSKHLSSRLDVEKELAKGRYALTALRAGIIIGSGSASFEIIRDLVEKLPVMIAPKWLMTRCQPIGIVNVLEFLSGVLGVKETYHKNYDIGGPEILTYKQMLLEYGRSRGLKRWIFAVPVMTPRLSSYWLYFVTSTSYKLASALVQSMKVEVVCRNDDLSKLLNIRTLNYMDSLQRALDKIQHDAVQSSWKDAFSSGDLNYHLSEHIQVPEHGCFVDRRVHRITDPLQTMEKVWSIGGEQGWYYATWLWRIRGFLDRLVGGVGLRRGRTHQHDIQNGDAVDFWRVLLADRSARRLLLYAEMKVPGDAWLEFRVEDEQLIQTATFRAKGLIGRAYWYAVYPFHGVIFNGLLRKLSV